MAPKRFIARRPVLVLGPKCDLPRHRKISRALFATDLEPHSLAAIPILERFWGRFKWKLWVVRAIPKNRASERSQVRRHLKSRFESVSDPRLFSKIAGFRVAVEPPVEAVINSARVLRAGVIVMGVRTGGPLTRAATHMPWAIAQRVIAEATCPVLTIRASPFA